MGTSVSPCKQADVLSVSSADANSIAKSQLALSEAEPARHYPKPLSLNPKP
jgi:hypothetical protein